MLWLLEPLFCLRLSFKDRTTRIFLPVSDKSLLWTLFSVPKGLYLGSMFLLYNLHSGCNLRWMKKKSVFRTWQLFSGTKVNILTLLHAFHRHCGKSVKANAAIARENVNTLVSLGSLKGENVSFPGIYLKTYTIWKLSFSPLLREGKMTGFKIWLQVYSVTVKCLLSY